MAFPHAAPRLSCRSYYEVISVLLTITPPEVAVVTETLVIDQRAVVNWRTRPCIGVEVVGRMFSSFQLLITVPNSVKAGSYRLMNTLVVVGCDST